jgi:hypothetical protein
MVQFDSVDPAALTLALLALLISVEALLSSTLDSFAAKTLEHLPAVCKESTGMDINADAKKSKDNLLYLMQAMKGRRLLEHHNIFLPQYPSRFVWPILKSWSTGSAIIFYITISIAKCVNIFINEKPAPSFVDALDWAIAENSCLTDWNPLIHLLVQVLLWTGKSKVLGPLTIIDYIATGSVQKASVIFDLQTSKNYDFHWRGDKLWRWVQGSGIRWLYIKPGEIGKYSEIKEGHLMTTLARKIVHFDNPVLCFHLAGLIALDQLAIFYKCIHTQAQLAGRFHESQSQGTLPSQQQENHTVDDAFMHSMISHQWPNSSLPGAWCCENCKNESICCPEEYMPIVILSDEEAQSDLCEIPYAVKLVLTTRTSASVHLGGSLRGLHPYIFKDRDVSISLLATVVRTNPSMLIVVPVCESED